MPIEAVKIPQNVYVEDRIVGPLTLRQVMIVAIGGGGSYAIWSSLTKSFGQLDIVTNIITWTPAVLSLAFAFIRINDLSLMRLLLLRIERMQKPSVRTWGPRAGISITVRTFTAADQKKTPITNAQIDVKKQKLEEFQHALHDDAAADAGPADDDLPVRTVAIPAGSTGSPQPPAAPPPPVDQSAISVDGAGGASVDGIRARSSMYSASEPAHA